MHSNRGWIVITTINPPTPAVKAIAALRRQGWNAVVVGDTKTPSDWHEEGIHFLSIQRQKELFGTYADLVPYRHYGRKNLGYLYALSQGAELILETDDDNNPYASFGQNIERRVSGRRVAHRGWVNIYKGFTEAPIWPRGLPLDDIRTSFEITPLPEATSCAIQQYLADTDPDVDAIYRLAVETPVDFNPQASPVILEKGSWCPFNSQNTVFFPEAFALLYLPCHVSFRMTDIWRSFVAQAALWAHGGRVAFHGPTVRQVRNVHDLMKDFKDEVIGYLENKRIARTLEETLSTLKVQDQERIDLTALALWKSLHTIGIIPDEELPLLEGWFERLRAKGTPHS